MGRKIHQLRHSRRCLQNLSVKSVKTKKATVTQSLSEDRLHDGSFLHGEVSGYLVTDDSLNVGPTPYLHKFDQSN